MKHDASRRARRRALRGVALWLLLVSLHPAPARTQPSELVAIVHPDNPTGDLSLHALRMFYGGYKRSWRGGGPVHVILPESQSQAMSYVVKRIFRKGSEEQILQYYLEAVFRHRMARAPEQLDPAMAVAVVGSHPGALAIVAREDLPSDAPVKVLGLGGT